MKSISVNMIASIVLLAINGFHGKRIYLVKPIALELPLASECLLITPE